MPCHETDPSRASARQMTGRTVARKQGTKTAMRTYRPTKAPAGLQEPVSPARNSPVQSCALSPIEPAEPKPGFLPAHRHFIRSVSPFALPAGPCSKRPADTNSSHFPDVRQNRTPNDRPGYGNRPASHS